MGQYHKVAAVGINQFLDPHDLGCGLKMLEQGFTYAGTRAALIALISRLPGNQPADLAYCPAVGTWAGSRILGIGDYAEDGDIPEWEGPVLDELYGLCQDPPALQDYLHWRKPGETEEQAQERARASLAEAEREWTERFKDALHQPFRNVSPDIIGLLESGCGVRFSPNDCGWRAFACVKALAQIGEDGRAHYHLTRPQKPRLRADMLISAGGIETDVNLDAGKNAESDQELLDYYARCSGTRDRWWDRAPMDSAHHNFRDSEIDLGQSRVIVSLTSREYLDPIEFGEVPTTAALMRGDQYGSVATATLLMAMNDGYRGGGDCDTDRFPQLGIWHGHQLIATAEREPPGSEFPTTEEVKASFTNISAKVARSMKNARNW